MNVCCSDLFLCFFKSEVLENKCGWNIFILPGVNVNNNQAKVHIKVYEDNAGAIEFAKEKQFRPRTKCFNCRLHHFRHHVEVTREVSVHKIDTKCQQADMITKPVATHDPIRILDTSDQLWQVRR